MHRERELSMSQRRALRVPISDIPLASAADDVVEDESAATDVSNVVELEPSSGVSPAVDPEQDRDPTEPTLRT